MYTVGEVAKLAGVSVRTLHYYGAIELVLPSGHSSAGYRLYSLTDLERMQQVLFYRECGFKLEAIRQFMSHPMVNREHALTIQREALPQQRVRIGAMLDLIDKTLRTMREGIQMTPEEMLGAFGDFNPSEYEDEVNERWGHTDAYKESMRRTKEYGVADWQKIQDENSAISQRMIAAFDHDVQPDASEAMDIAESARLVIERAFYPCSHLMHAALAEGYESDARFRASYDKQRQGLAVWFSSAIKANANRHSA